MLALMQNAAPSQNAAHPKPHAAWNLARGLAARVQAQFGRPQDLPRLIGQRPAWRADLAAVLDRLENFVRRLLLIMAADLTHRLETALKAAPRAASSAADARSKRIGAACDKEPGDESQPRWRLRFKYALPHFGEHPRSPGPEQSSLAQSQRVSMAEAAPPERRPWSNLQIAALHLKACGEALAAGEDIALRDSAAESGAAMAQRLETLIRIIAAPEPFARRLSRRLQKRGSAAIFYARALCEAPEQDLGPYPEPLAQMLDRAARLLNRRTLEAAQGFAPASRRPSAEPPVAPSG